MEWFWCLKGYLGGKKSISKMLLYSFVFFQILLFGIGFGGIFQKTLIHSFALMHVFLMDIIYFSVML